MTVSHITHILRIFVALCLNHNLAASDRIRIKCDSVNATIAASLRNFNFAAAGRKFLFKQLADQMLKLFPPDSRDIGLGTHAVDNVVTVDATLTGSIHVYDGPYGRQRVDLRACDAL